eukprot:Skav215596  [mRNA]  locus=scaffold666:281211:294284:+ [translate_table: standard]
MLVSTAHAAEEAPGKPGDQWTFLERSTQFQGEDLMIVQLGHLREAYGKTLKVLGASLVDGESLRAYAHRQPCHKLPEQVVDGVTYCHDHLVAHRDLKLENLLLDKSREGVKIIDFGFAAHVPSKETKLKAFCGTPSYMAPEIIRGEGYSGFAADVWALGVVIFALLSGTLPFAAKTEMQLYARIRRASFTFPDGSFGPLAQCPHVPTLYL